MSIEVSPTSEPMQGSLAELIAEAHRQVSVCNACRYCEGYCAVFPAMHLQRTFSDGDIAQLSNLCHNCRGCYYACQYSDPHEFNINLPRALADARASTWENCVRPSRVSRLFQRAGVWLSALLVLLFTVLFMAVMNSDASSDQGFYAYMSHGLLILIFIPAFVLPLLFVGAGLKRYWRLVSGESVRLTHVKQALVSAAKMKNLSGGQDQGCNYEEGDRFTTQRRTAHHLVMYGFLLCFASTSVATLLHYVFNITAPYGLFSLPKLLGLPGGVLLTIGCVWLLKLKSSADSRLSATNALSGEIAFIALLGATGATGLALYVLGGTSWLPLLLAIHLATVLTFFLSLPYTKMVHGFFRLAALIKDAQVKEAQLTTGSSSE